MAKRGGKEMIHKHIWRICGNCFRKTKLAIVCPKCKEHQSFGVLYSVNNIPGIKITEPISKYWYEEVK